MLTNHCANPEYWHRPTKGPVFHRTDPVNLRNLFLCHSSCDFLSLYIYLNFGEDLALSQQLAIGSKHLSEGGQEKYCGQAFLPLAWYVSFGGLTSVFFIKRVQLCLMSHLSVVQLSPPISAASSHSRVQTTLKKLSAKELRKNLNGKDRNLCHCKAGKGAATFSVHGWFTRMGYHTLFTGCVVLLFIHKIITDPGQIQSLSCPDLR